MVVPRVAFDDALFTRRELRLMHELSTNFADELTKSLIGFAHEDRRPWDKIWDGGRGNNERIPYTLTIPDSDPNRDAILEAAREYEDVLAAAVCATLSTDIRDPAPSGLVGTSTLLVIPTDPE